MALQYGFGFRGNMSQEDSDQKFAALSEEDRGFYHNHLPWMLMAADVGIVSEESIPHIVARLEVHSNEMGKEYRVWVRENYEMGLGEYLTRFIGFSANIYTESNANFMKKIAKRLPTMSRKELEAIRNPKDMVGV